MNNPYSMPSTGSWQKAATPGDGYVETVEEPPVQIFRRNPESDDLLKRSRIDDLHVPRGEVTVGTLHPGMKNTVSTVSLGHRGWAHSLA